ncbi:UDP-N-acetylmuramate dehydrogenase [Pseudoclavibacter sp. VKM Ac-2888]|uniref:UDP-N-acetylmuramate dehydrogenase n=1 Tax=Pseudoclavibacter sp. VKM Ac-2888 TaxID=2783830 RepID=UPI00188A85A5|nr:UDP-N-acetylmuramate dehydrogenase [Pseudoclavibacter sp. VKM Ac-2888]MBF4552435.1 UDP-N-acetylmuramate dehydrogenase [Pseudoclavibacter sp. VKM Ac-2888]
MTRLSELTTTQVGGEATQLVAPATRPELIAAAEELFANYEQPLILGGGSNTIATDDRIDEPVLHVVTKGIHQLDGPVDKVGQARVRIDAGESWSALVDYAVARNWSGIEALAGIPGSVGATPVQNIGAYGQELSDVLARIEFYDADADTVRWIDAADLGLGYRTSAIKRGELRGVVTRVELDLVEMPEGQSEPVRYDQLARALDVPLGERMPVHVVRDAVIRLRASKGMVLDAHDRDSVSSGSFFMNPIVRSSFASELPEMPKFDAGKDEDGSPLVKLSAAWLIDHAGVQKGFSLPGSNAAISSKHTLAITNRGGATAEQIVELARFVRARVEAEYGVRLVNEPVLVDLTI